MYINALGNCTCCIFFLFQAVNLLENEQSGKEYSELNPMEQVPTLVIDGHTLTQSTAIMEYLNETYLRPALLPANPVKKAQVL